MTLAIICTNKDPKPWVAALHEIDPSLDIQLFDDPQGDPKADKAKVTFALCWKHPQGALADYPNLRCISSMGAGIDHFFNDADFPTDTPVVRLVDPMLAQSMFEYISTTVLYYFRQLDVYQAQQKHAHWLQQPPKAKADMTIGIMGLGNLGGYAAQNLATMGFNLIGWSRSHKIIEGVETFAGEQQLTAFLAGTDVLVCLLPLTEQTRGILNSTLFNALPKGAYVINVARGEHLVEADLLQALDAGQLGGACLDVFNQEPLPPDHPFWSHDNIMVTPHISSITDPRSVAPQVVDNYRRMEKGLPLLHQVDVLLGY